MTEPQTYILVTGSREELSEARIRWGLEWAFANLRAKFPKPADIKPTVIHGAAAGADTLAGMVAKEWGWNVLEFPADWKTYGRGAGPRRNSEMITNLKALIAGLHPIPIHAVCLAFPCRASIGTWDCIRKAQPHWPVLIVPGGAE